MFVHVGLKPIEMKTVTVDGKRHYVTPTGHKHPSATTVINSNSAKQKKLNEWKRRVGKKKAQQISTNASSKGNRYHKIVEDYLNNCLDLEVYKDTPLPILMYQASKSILDRINNIYLQEAALYSDTLGIAGRVDCIAEFDGVLSIIDFKTSNNYKEEDLIYDYYVQECAYGCMFLECYGLKVEQLVTIIACNDGTVQLKIKKPKKEYFLKLLEYINEYKNKNDQESGG